MKALYFINLLPIHAILGLSDNIDVSVIVKLVCINLYLFETLPLKVHSPPLRDNQLNNVLGGFV